MGKSKDKNDTHNTHIMERVEVVAHKRTRKGDVQQSVVEQYLRTDIPCKSPLCTHARCASAKALHETSTLPADAKCYAIPDPQTAGDYSEIFQHAAIKGVIFLQTVYESVKKDRERRIWGRIRECILDPRKQTVLFSNENFAETFSPRKIEAESDEDHSERLVLRAATWYREHLAGRVPIALITASQPLKEKAATFYPLLQVLTMKEYITTYWSHEQPLVDLCDFVDDALARAEEHASLLSQEDLLQQNEHGYIPYKSEDVLLAGIKSGMYVQGSFHVNKGNSSEAFIKFKSNMEDKDFVSRRDMLISGKGDQNRAVHGDTVVVQPYPEAMWRSSAEKLAGDATQGEGRGDAASRQPTGRVVGILTKKWRDYVATLAEGEDESRGSTALCVPMDQRVPKIRIRMHHKTEMTKCRFIVRIDSWSLESMWPEGHLVSSLGEIGTLETETRALLIENDISVAPFSEKLLEELKDATKDQVGDNPVFSAEGRRDVRASHFIFSIDPIGCEDVDDALCARRLKNGNLELSVHIADVSHYVKPGMLVDAEAKSRSTTVYLVDRRYDMLPFILSGDLCSLWDQVDRYAMSVFWEFDKDFRVVRTWFGRTLIRSAFKLYYELAQQLFDGLSWQEAQRKIPSLAKVPAKEAEASVEQVREGVKLLTLIARELKARRQDTGGLSLESGEIRVQLDENHKNVQQLLQKEALEVHEVVAECMIFANRAVAERISEVFPTLSLLRHHPLPEEEQFEALISSAMKKGFAIDISSNVALAKSLDGAVDPNDPEFNKILRMLATQAMSEAQYFSTGSLSSADWFHYGLGLSHYTHFTSPIRRYADVIVHRLLMASLDVVPNTADPGYKEYLTLDEVAKMQRAKDAIRAHKLLSGHDLQALADHINGRNRASKIAQSDSLTFFQSLFFAAKEESPKDREAEGVITRMRKNGVVVHIPAYGFSSVIHLADKEGHALIPAGLLGRAGDPTEVVAGGRIEVLKDGLAVTDESGQNRFEFYAFDHVRVRVTVQPSRYRLADLKLLLIGKVEHPAGAQGTKQSRKALIENATASAAAAASAGSNAQAQGSASLLRLSSEATQPYCQAAGSLYDLFTHFQDLSMNEDEAL